MFSPNPLRDGNPSATFSRWRTAYGLPGLLLAVTAMVAVAFVPTGAAEPANPAPNVAAVPAAVPAAKAAAEKVPGGLAEAAAGKVVVDVWRPLLVLAIGIAIVLGLIIVLKTNAFIALIGAAMAVSLLSPGDAGTKITRVADAFGSTTGKIGVVIALAAVIGTCMLDSGAADRIVRAFMGMLGERRAPVALMGAGYVLAIPVFFDTVFYLLVPLARSMHRRTQKQYLKYLLAIAAGGAVTHTLVPPTPGPLATAANLQIDLGWMIMVGAVVAVPAGIAGLIFADLCDRWMPVPMRKTSTDSEREPLEDSQLPSLGISLLPIILPVILISMNTLLTAVSKGPTPLWNVDPNLLAACEILGNANLALLISTVIAMWMLTKQRQVTLTELGQVVETSLMSAGVIILITAGGGAFGGMLTAAQVGDAVKELFSGMGGGGSMMLLLGFAVAAVLKVAQGSSTVAMITASGMLTGAAKAELLGFHPVYLATAIAGGSLVGSWMNDSGFWIFAKMGGLTEMEALKSWSILLVVLGVVSLLTSLVLANFVPLI